MLTYMGRLLGCPSCLMVMYLQMQLSVLAQDADHFHSILEHEAVVITCALWGTVLVGVLLVILCHRYGLWQKLYRAAHKYNQVSQNDEQANTVVVVEELAVMPNKSLPLVIENCPQTNVTFPDVHVDDFLAHVQHMKKDSDLGFSLEFCDITEVSNMYTFPAEHFFLEENQEKNRYLNIAVYDHSRVVLKSDEACLNQSDYINASYVQGYSKEKAYIATQGPLPQTVADFWRMVWEQNSAVIVMITNLVEHGRVKCDQYWPVQDEAIFGHLVVRPHWTRQRAGYTIRTFLLTWSQACYDQPSPARLVTQYHFLHWPDHGVPDHVLPALAFIRKSAGRSQAGSGPVVVHCSAGVGRTGTYIVIQSMIAQLEDQQCVNVARCILEIRKQRSLLVQTEEQYKFIHEVLAEYILQKGSTEVRQEHMSEHLVQLGQPAPGSQLTLLQTQFQLVTCDWPQDYELDPAAESFNLAKNRTGSMLPVAAYRVVLPVQPGVAGSDYINATFLQSFVDAKALIVTQQPLDNTVGDFWRMVWHVKSTLMVFLTSGWDQEMKEFWPALNETMVVEGFTIVAHKQTLLQASHGFSIVQLVISSAQSDAPLSTQVMLVDDWLFHTEELQTVLRPVIAAQENLYTVFAGSVIIVDRFGGCEAGTFCALWSLLEQILLEQRADFYYLCKLYHWRRPGIFNTSESYFFLHQVMAAFCEHEKLESASSHGSLL